MLRPRLFCFFGILPEAAFVPILTCTAYHIDEEKKTLRFNDNERLDIMYTEENNMIPREKPGDERLSHMSDNRGHCCGTANNCCRRREDNCTRCTPSKTFGLEGYPLASMYAPLQEFRNLYDKETAFTEGTLFTELNLPFMGASVGKGGCLCD